MDAREFTNGMHLIPLDQDKEPTCGRGFLDEANYEQNTQKVIPGEMYGVLTGRPNRGTLQTCQKRGFSETRFLLGFSDSGFPAEELRRVDRGVGAIFRR